MTRDGKRSVRPPFDPSREFVCSRPLPVSGQKLDSGSPFPRDLVSTRRLRQMYDARWIEFAPDDVKPKPRVARRRARLRADDQPTAQ